MHRSQSPRTEQGLAGPRTACCLLVLLLAAVPAVARADAVDDKLAELRAAGEPVDIKDIIPPPVADDENAALYYLDAIDALSPQSSEIYGSVDWDDPVSAGTAKAQVARDEEALACVREAATKERCRFDVKYEDGFAALLPHYAKTRALARFVAAAAVSAAMDDDYKEAAERLRLGFVLARHVGQDPLFIGVLVTVAMDVIVEKAAAEVLARGELDRESAVALSAELGRIDYVAMSIRAMQTERANGVKAFRQVREDPAFAEGVAELVGGDGPDLDANALAKHAQSDEFVQDELAYLQYMGTACELLALPWREAKNRWPAEGEFGEYTGPLHLTKVLAPALGRLPQKRDEAIARRRLLQAALAVESYYSEHGKYPAALADAQAEDLPVPMDVFSGGPFVYAVEDDEMTLYSVGPDMADDGGKWASPESDDISWPPAPGKR